MLENIRLSFKGLWSHKLRSFLTMLGIIIGIASIIAIVSTIKGTNEQIKQNLIGSGTNMITVSLYQNDYEYDTSGSIANGLTPVSQDTIEEIKNKPSVLGAAAYNYRANYSGSYYYGNTVLEGLATYGIDTDYLPLCGYKIVSGREITQKDIDNFSAVAVIDSDTAKTFGNDDPIGKTIEYNGFAFKIVGVAEANEQSAPVIKTIEDYYTYMSSSGEPTKIFIPKSVWPEIYQYDEPERVVVKAVDTDSISTAGSAARDVLNSYISSSDIKYKAQDVLQKVQELQKLSAASNNQLIWIASIALLVGGIGVMNIMLVSVTERTKEIGLKKAIGAKKKRILVQFLTESAVLTSIGGILGACSGIGLAYLIAYVTGAPVAIDIPVMIFAVIFSMMIGIIFGLIPSIKAANLNPIDALRYE